MAKISVTMTTAAVVAITRVATEITASKSIADERQLPNETDRRPRTIEDDRDGAAAGPTRQ